MSSSWTRSSFYGKFRPKTLANMRSSYAMNFYKWGGLLWWYKHMSKGRFGR